MKRCLFGVLMIALISIPGCRTTFAAAQTAVERYVLTIKSTGSVETASNLTYAYAEGSGTVSLTIIDKTKPEGSEPVWEWTKNGDFSNGWQMIWDAEKERPKVIDVAIAEAKAGLKAAPPEVTS